MGKPVKNYDFTKHVFVTLGGYRLGGWGEEGGIELEYGGDVAEVTKSADGLCTVSYNNDTSMIATITMSSSQKGYKDVSDLLRAQLAQAAEGALGPLEFLLEDAINGDKVTEQYAVFLTRPVPSKMKKVGDVTFKLLLPNAAEDAVFGGNITI